jgi:hypothetical protein
MKESRDGPDSLRCLGFVFSPARAPASPAKPET